MKFSKNSFEFSITYGLGQTTSNKTAIQAMMYKFKLRIQLQNVNEDIKLKIGKF